MRILFVIDVFNTHSNGTSISAQRFAEELRKRGHDVRILTVGEDSDTIFGLKELYFPFFMKVIHKHGFMYAKCEEKTIREAVEWAEIVHFFFPFFLTNYTKKVVDEMGKPSTAAFHVQPQNITSSLLMGKSTWANNLCRWASAASRFMLTSSASRRATCSKFARRKQEKHRKSSSISF